MTTEQMWQAVAEKIEPFASLPKPQDECWYGVPSPFGLWVNISEYGEGDIPKWELRAYDAEMCLMLLKRLSQTTKNTCSLEFVPIAYFLTGEVKTAAYWSFIPNIYEKAIFFWADTPELVILDAAYSVLCKPA